MFCCKFVKIACKRTKKAVVLKISQSNEFFSEKHFVTWSSSPNKPRLQSKYKDIDISSKQVLLKTQRFYYKPRFDIFQSFERFLSVSRITFLSRFHSWLWLVPCLLSNKPIILCVLDAIHLTHVWPKLHYFLFSLSVVVSLDLSNVIANVSFFPLRG